MPRRNRNARPRPAQPRKLSGAWPSLVPSDPIVTVCHVKGITGGSLGGRIEVSHRKRRSIARARAAEERRWKQLSGPVVIHMPDRDLDDRQVLAG